MDKHAFNLLQLGENGNYKLLIPDFGKAKLIESTKDILASKLTPFGFPFHHEYMEKGKVYENRNFLPEDVQAKLCIQAFEKFFMSLREKKQACGADYVLIKITRDSIAAGYNWLIEAECQFYQKIAFEYVSPTVYRLGPML